MKNKLPISAIIVCLNEANNIERCIKSIKHIVDEIIIVDTGSTDDTIKIAKQNGVITKSIQWLGYGSSKNKANQFASNPWILSLDADEEVSAQLSLELKQINYSKYNTVYSLNRLMFYQGQWIKYGAWHPDYVPRLFPKDKAQWNDAIVHESLIHKLQSQKLGGYLNHYSYNSVEDHLQRIDRYAVLKAKQWINDKKNPSILKRLFGPSFRAFKGYVIDQGFRNGKIGLHLAKMDFLQVKKELEYYQKMAKDRT